MAPLSIAKIVESAVESFQGWDWPHDPGGILVDGPGAVADWDEWERKRVAELEAADAEDWKTWGREQDDDVSPCADRKECESIASAERAYGERAQECAEEAARRAKGAVEQAEIGWWRRAVSEAERAVETEREFGGDEIYEPLRKAIVEAAHEASCKLAKDGLRVRRVAGYMRIDAGGDLWYCPESDWDAALANWNLVLDIDGEDPHEASACAFDWLCQRLTCVYSYQGSSDVTPEEQGALFRALIDAREIDEVDVPAGIDVGPSTNEAGLVAADHRQGR
jgi:hypothetical protein